MQVSTKGRYALRLMVDLGGADDEYYTPLREVAERQNISEKYLEQIVRPLARAGLVKSARGVQGGYKLALDSEDITVGQILRTVEGDLAPVPCVAGAECNCERESICATVDVWRSIKESVDNVVDHISLKDLVEKDKEGRGACPSTTVNL